MFDRNGGPNRLVFDGQLLMSPMRMHFSGSSGRLGVLEVTSSLCRVLDSCHAIVCLVGLA